MSLLLDVDGAAPAHADCSAARSVCRAVMWSPSRCSCCCASSMSRCKMSTLLRSFNATTAACCSRRAEALHRDYTDN